MWRPLVEPVMGVSIRALAVVLLLGVLLGMVLTAELLTRSGVCQ